MIYKVYTVPLFVHFQLGKTLTLHYITLHTYIATTLLWLISFPFSLSLSPFRPSQSRPEMQRARSSSWDHNNKLCVGFPSQFHRNNTKSTNQRPLTLTLPCPSVCIIYHNITVATFEYGNLVFCGKQLLAVTTKKSRSTVMLKVNNNKQILLKYVVMIAFVLLSSSCCYSTTLHWCNDDNLLQFVSFMLAFTMYYVIIPVINMLTVTPLWSRFCDRSSSLLRRSF